MQVKQESECPALLPPNSPTATSYNLHINLSTKLRPQLLLRATRLGPLISLFNHNSFECLVSLGNTDDDDDDVIFNDIIFRLSARIVATNDGHTFIDCIGETVCYNPTTVEPLIKDTPNKERLSIKAQFLLYQYILTSE